MIRVHRILVPTDFSEYSEKAFAKAIEIARDTTSRVDLLHVIQLDVIQCADIYCIDQDQIKEIKDQMDNSARKQLQDQIKKFTNLGGVEIIPIVRHGVPYNEILAHQKEENIDLIVMSHIGRTGSEKFFLGGVTRNVIKGASCSVLLVK